MSLQKQSGNEKIYKMGVSIRSVARIKSGRGETSQVPNNTKKFTPRAAMLLLLECICVEFDTAGVIPE